MEDIPKVVAAMTPALIAGTATRRATRVFSVLVMMTLLSDGGSAVPVSPGRATTFPRFR
jgi:hypothetical protein